jgi:hypothetical protein
MKEPGVRRQQMKFVERMIQKWNPEAMAAIKSLADKYGDLDAKWGFPPQRHYRCWYGSIPFEYLISEREWESLAVMEATYARAQATPEWAEFAALASKVGESHRAELYEVLSD